MNVRFLRFKCEFALSRTNAALGGRISNLKAHRSQSSVPRVKLADKAAEISEIKRSCGLK